MTSSPTRRGGGVNLEKGAAAAAGAERGVRPTPNSRCSNVVTTTFSKLLLFSQKKRSGQVTFNSAEFLTFGAKITIRPSCISSKFPHVTLGGFC